MSHYRYIIKNNLFDEPVAAFLANGDTPNLLNSTFLEMTEFIRQADTKMVMLHFADEYWPRVKHISYVRTFKLLKDAADNVRVRSQHPPPRAPAGPSSSGDLLCHTSMQAAALTPRDAIPRLAQMLCVLHHGDRGGRMHKLLLARISWRGLLGPHDHSLINVVVDLVHEQQCSNQARDGDLWVLVRSGDASRDFHEVMLPVCPSSFGVQPLGR